MSNQWPGDYWGQQPGHGGYGPPPPGDPWTGGQPSGPYGSAQGPYGGYPPPGGGYPPPGGGGYPQSPPAKGSAIAALIVAILTVVLCCATNIIGIVFAAIAIGNDRSPEEMEKFTRYAWIANIVHVVLVVVGFGGIMLLGLSGSLD
ncbi:hypothetical protein CLV63_103394 [Murinocardiopsis flavida]|uniref:Interferon-induced transmembrane protein n=1 Tax=Murinocardiopsis flavida TaxID=645275 RepID=A0A2P8DR25_9ACTN|nr:hypothetical protein [Murinocardiopsis flavida]PSK99667.1 hypothetical protein CLV63_103394 [Murinocardiopsis flavida]